MPKRFKPPGAPRQAPSRPSVAPRRHDLITRLHRFCEFFALGLVAAALVLPFPNDFNHPGSHAVHVSLESLPGGIQKIAAIAIHTRATSATLAILGTIVAVAAYRHRYATRPHRIVIAGTIAVLIVIACHAAALGYLQSLGTLKIEARGPAPAAFDAADLPPATTLSSTNPTFRVESVTRLAVAEGTAEEWQLLFAGDAMFAAPVLLAWILRWVVSRFSRQPQPEIDA